MCRTRTIREKQACACLKSAKETMLKKCKAPGWWSHVGTTVHSVHKHTHTHANVLRDKFGLLYSCGYYITFFWFPLRSLCPPGTFKPAKCRYSRYLPEFTQTHNPPISVTQKYLNEHAKEDNHVFSQVLTFGFNKNKRKKKKKKHPSVNWYSPTPMAVQRETDLLKAINIYHQLQLHLIPSSVTPYWQQTIVSIFTHLFCTCSNFR